MKRVFWTSRNQMTSEQLLDLERVMGDSVGLHPLIETVENLEALKPTLDRADAVEAVLPPEQLSCLLKLAVNRTVLQAVAVRTATGRIMTLPDGRWELIFSFSHGCWRQFLRLELEYQDLSG